MVGVGTCMVGVGAVHACTGPSEPDNPPRRKTPPRRVVGTHRPGPVHEHPSWPKRQLLAQLGGSRATLESYTGVGALATRPARLGAPTCPVSHRPHSPGVLVATTPFILQPPASSRSHCHSITVLQRCSAATRTGDSCSPTLAPKRTLGPNHLLEYFTVRMHPVGRTTVYPAHASIRSTRAYCTVQYMCALRAPKLRPDHHLVSKLAEVDAEAHSRASSHLESTDGQASNVLFGSESSP